MTELKLNILVPGLTHNQKCPRKQHPCTRDKTKTKKLRKTKHKSINSLYQANAAKRVQRGLDSG